MYAAAIYIYVFWGPLIFSNLLNKSARVAMNFQGQFKPMSQSLSERLFSKPDIWFLWELTRKIAH